MTAPAMAAVHADQPALAASPARPAPQTAASQITSATTGTRDSDDEELPISTAPTTTGARYALAVTVAIAARLVCVRRPARPAAKAAERNTRKSEARTQRTRGLGGPLAHQDHRIGVELYRRNVVGTRRTCRRAQLLQHQSFITGKGGNQRRADLACAVAQIGGQGPGLQPVL